MAFTKVSKSASLVIFTLSNQLRRRRDKTSENILGKLAKSTIFGFRLARL